MDYDEPEVLADVDEEDLDEEESTAATEEE